MLEIRAKVTSGSKLLGKEIEALVEVMNVAVRDTEPMDLAFSCP